MSPVNQKVGPHQTTKLPVPRSYTFQPLELLDITFCGF